MEKNNSITLTLLVLFIVYMTDTVIFATNFNSKFELLSHSIICIAAVCMFLYYVLKYKRFLKSDIYIFLSIISIIVSMLLAGRIFGFSYIMQACCFIFGWMFSYKYSQEKFAYNYIRIMRVIAVVSLIGYILGNQIVNIDILPNITNSNGMDFKNLFLTNIPIEFNQRRRIWGPFWEPGVYQAYLMVAIYFSLYYKYKHRVFNVLLFAVTATLTLSGAMLIPLILFSLSYIVNKDKYLSSRKTKIIIVIGLIMITSFVLLNARFDEMLFKVTGGFESHSFAFRFSSIIVNIQEFIRHPIFGSTPENLDLSRSLFMYNLTGTSYLSNTNTLFAFFAYYGLYVGLVYTWNVLLFFKSRIDSKLALIPAFIGFVATTSNENLCASLFFCTIIFLVPENERLKRIKKLAHT